MTGQRFNKEKQEEDNSFDAGFKIPETKGVLSNLKSAARLAHMQEQEEDEKAGKPKKKRPRRSICYCEDPSCGIGPFIETQGGDEG